MKQKNVKRVNIKIPAIVMCVVSVVCLVCGGLYAYFGEGSFKMESRATIEIETAKDIETLGASIDNNYIKLAKDIRVSNEDFCVGDRDAEFSGTFDGCGHTVYLDYSVGKTATSLFSSVARKGVIKNTRFVFSNVTVSGEAFSGVVKINYGTIQDCVVEYALQFNSKEGMYTPFVAVNCGVVKNIVTSGTFKYALDDVVAGNAAGSWHSETKNDDEKKIAFASACVYNYGKLKNVISTPRFVGFYCTNRDNYLAGRCDNVSVAAVCAFSCENGVTSKKGDSAKSTESGLVAVCEKTLYTSDDSRLDKFESFASLIFDVDGAVDKTIIENTYDFNNTVWQIDEKALCLKLIVQSDSDK